MGRRFWIKAHVSVCFGEIRPIPNPHPIIASFCIKSNALLKGAFPPFLMIINNYQKIGSQRFPLQLNRGVWSKISAFAPIKLSAAIVIVRYCPNIFSLLVDPIINPRRNPVDGNRQVAIIY